MSEISVAVVDGVVEVRAPFHPDFSGLARRIGGRWAAPVWRFDARDEAAARALVVDLFGHDGEPVAVTTVLVAVDAVPDLRGELRVCGRLVARRRARDADVQLGDGVIIRAGNFPGRGGSSANPRLAPEPGTVLEVRDVPVGHKDLAEPWVALAEPETAVDALRVERAALLDRVAEIDGLLAVPEVRH